MANNGSLITNQDTAGRGTVTATDADGDSLTYSLVTNGSKGNVTITAGTGAYTYTPTLNQSGTDTFTFKANDGTVDSNIATVTVTIMLNSASSPASSSQTDLTPYQQTGLAIRVTIEGSGQGRVISTTAGLDQAIDCSVTHPTGCLARFVPAAEVTLIATPAEGSTFAGWGGNVDCVTGHFLVTGGKLCTAYFHLVDETLTVVTQGRGRVSGPGIDCPGQCTGTYPYGTTVTLTAQTPRWMWNFSHWQGCDSQGHIQLTNDALCQAVFTPDPNIPNAGDGNRDGLLDAHQLNVISLPDKVKGNYVSFEVQPDTCVISDVYTDLPENYGKPDKNKPLPQGLIYFDLACPQAQISVYYHALSVVRRNFIFQKFGPTVPGDLKTVDWFTLPNVTFEAVPVGDQTVVKATYTVTDGGLGDSTGVDGRIVDPAGLGLE